MKKIEMPISNEDDRGIIQDLVENELINAITRITFKTGATRANHYHKETTQWNYVISGRIRLVTKLPDQEVSDVVMEVGELYETVPMEQHALQALEDAELLVFTRGPRGGQDYETDTYRLETPLI